MSSQSLISRGMISSSLSSLSPLSSISQAYNYISFTSPPLHSSSFHASLSPSPSSHTMSSSHLLCPPTSFSSLSPSLSFVSTLSSSPIPFPSPSPSRSFTNRTSIDRMKLGPSIRRYKSFLLHRHSHSPQVFPNHKMPPLSFSYHQILSEKQVIPDDLLDDEGEHRVPMPWKGKNLFSEEKDKIKNTIIGEMKSDRESGRLNGNENTLEEILAATEEKSSSTSPPRFVLPPPTPRPSPSPSLDDSTNLRSISRSQHQNIQISHQKLNDICRLIRGLHVDEALIQLRFCQKRKGVFVANCIRAAVVSGMHNFHMNRKRLIVKEAYVGKSMHLKRIDIKGRGRHGMKRRYYSHLKVVIQQVPYTTNTWEELPASAQGAVSNHHKGSPYKLGVEVRVGNKGKKTETIEREMVGLKEYTKMKKEMGLRYDEPIPLVRRVAKVINYLDMWKDISGIREEKERKMKERIDRLSSGSGSGSGEKGKENQEQAAAGEKLH